MTDETQSDPIIGEARESREGKLARKHKVALTAALEDLRDVMNEARADGFTVEFAIQSGPDGAYLIADGHPVLVKRW